MTAMFSGEGERVPFKQSHYPEGSVEFWMTDILCEMKTTVQEQGPSWKSGRVQNGVPHLRVSLMDVVVGAATCSAAAGAGDSGKSSDRPRRGGELFWPFFEGEPRRRKSSSSIMA